MFYTTEEAAVLCGFLDGYLERDSVDAAVREKYEKFRLGLVQESLGRDDYIWATKALSFLRPHWWQDYEDQRALENALLKTQTLALKTKNGFIENLVVFYLENSGHKITLYTKRWFALANHFFLCYNIFRYFSIFGGFLLTLNQYLL